MQQVLKRENKFSRIISEADHMSFADAGLIEKMKASDTWRVVEKEEMD